MSIAGEEAADELGRRTGTAKVDLERQLPGVDAAGICFSLPMTGEGATDRVWIEGRPAPPKGEEPVLRGGSVSANYFKAMGIPLRQGRAVLRAEIWL